MPSWRGQAPLLIFYTINAIPISHRHPYQKRHVMLPVFVEKFLHIHIRHVTTIQLVLRVSSAIYTATTNLVQKYDGITELALLTTFQDFQATP